MRIHYTLPSFPTQKTFFFIIVLLALSCTQGFAKDFQIDLKKLKVGTYIEGTYYIDAQKKRFGGYINRTQGYAVTIVTTQ